MKKLIIGENIKSNEDGSFSCDISNGELKTLKDMQLDPEGFLGNVVHADDLRQEAIKWVKEELDRKAKAELKSWEELHEYTKQRFMDFFNLTEEEIK